MNEEICECGHPKARHAFRSFHCTVNIKNNIGIGYVQCNCPEYRPKVEKIDDTGTAGGSVPQGIERREGERDRSRGDLDVSGDLE